MKKAKKHYYRFVGEDSGISNVCMMTIGLVFGTTVIGILSFIIMMIGLFFPEIGLKFFD